MILRLLKSIWMFIQRVVNRMFHRAQVSILVPLGVRPDSKRYRDWEWLKSYWHYQLSGAEIIVGYDRHADEDHPFSKTQAVNDAASRAHGNMFIIADADCFIDTRYVDDALDQIRASRHNLWIVPYRHFFRLTEKATCRILKSDPRHPYVEPSPPPFVDLEEGRIDPSHYGHHFAAMIMIMPREAFECVGGMDPRFRGWGGEDISFMFAVDTLWGSHKTTDNDVLHLFHERIGVTFQDRKWENQTGRAVPMHRLAGRYHNARNDPGRMRALVDEGFEDGTIV